jgi:hypothetical protein
MNRSHTISIGLSSLAILLALGWVAAEPAAEPVSGSLDHRHAEQHARCAVARLRLAETRLEKAEKLNAALPGQVARMDLRWLRSRVEQLQDQVAVTRQKPHGYGFAAQQAAARSTARLAEEDLAGAIAANQRRPDAVGPLDIRILEQQREIAVLRAEIWEDPAFLADPTSVLQMQIDQLVDQMQDLLAKVETSRGLDRR